jgi:diguanylate cyclase (GGDEF)-like protein
MNLKAIKYRLTNDFQLAIISLLGVIALLGISPLTIFRATKGDWVAFYVDLLIQVGILAGVVRAWISGNTHGPSLFLAYFIGSSVFIAIYTIGSATIYWLYAVTVACFFLVERHHAMTIALVVMVTLMFTGALQLPTIEVISYFTTVLVCALFSYAFSYRTAMQRDQLETLASRDALTGIYNRRTMLDELERAHQTFTRKHTTCGILMLDLDHFKRVNDRYGHAAGDQVLLDLANLLEVTVRSSDRIFRFGGEEFLVLVQQTNIEEMALLAEKLRKAVDIKILDMDSRSITASIGGALLEPEETIESWFCRADKALYAAKDAGRNLVVIDGI